MIKPFKSKETARIFARSRSTRLPNEIVLGKRRITADTALRLARYFGTSPQFWMGLQNDYDLDVAADALGNRLDVEVRPMTVSG
jgi:antitoxin HigA-1